MLKHNQLPYMAATGCSSVAFELRLPRALLSFHTVCHTYIHILFGPAMAFWLEGLPVQSPSSASWLKAPSPSLLPGCLPAAGSPLPWVSVSSEQPLIILLELPHTFCVSDVCLLLHLGGAKYQVYLLPSSPSTSPFSPLSLHALI